MDPDGNSDNFSACGSETLEQGVDRSHGMFLNLHHN